MPQLGCITEQGNMGLGFTIISEEDVNSMKEELAAQYATEHKSTETAAETPKKG
jgi:hypothetical protein